MGGEIDLRESVLPFSAIFRELHDPNSHGTKTRGLVLILERHPLDINPAPRCQRMLLMNCHQVIGFIYKRRAVSSSCFSCPPTMSIQNSHSFGYMSFLADVG